MRSLYLGLFSRKPRNVFEGNYTELRADVLAAVYSDREQESSIFETLFLLLRESRKAVEDCKTTYSSEEYAALFKRFYHEDSPKYRTFLTILALCGMLRHDLEQRSSDASEEGKRMLQLLLRARNELENSPSEYGRWYLAAFLVVAELTMEGTQGSDAEVAQLMYTKISKAAFPNLLRKVWMQMDLSHRLSGYRSNSELK